MSLALTAMVLSALPGVYLRQELYSDAYLTTPQLLEKNGYPVEKHLVTSADGYVTSLHRVPRPEGVAVLLVHQLLGSSADWLLAGPRQGLGYLLHDAGYDVWMADIRGNVYSKKHVNMSTRNPKYWDFSFHEMGTEDLPAAVDHILGVKGAPDLVYVSHSLGADIFLVMTSARPEYNAKVRGVFAMAAGVFLNNSNSALFALASANPKPSALELLPRRRSMADIGVTFCSDGRITQYVCLYLWSLVGGYNYNTVNKTLLPVQLGHLPSGTSGKTMAHIRQLVNSGRFCQFDYGYKENVRRYGASKPPDYDLGSVTTPVAIYYGDNDLLVSVKDSRRLYNELKNSKGKSMKLFNTYSHFDFLWGIDVKNVVYDGLIESIKLL